MPGANVFISYAREDAEIAKVFYNELEVHDHQPWLDTRNILPGQQWELAIANGIREADVVLILLSSNSVNKRGFVQKEILTALKHWEEKLEDDIYLIPVRLNEIEIPNRLDKFQCYDYYTKPSLSILIAAIELALKQKMSGVNPIETISHKEENESYQIDFSYPRLISTVNRRFRERLNAIIAGSVSSSIESFIKQQKDIKLSNIGSQPKSQLFIDFSITLLLENYFSMVLYYSEYWQGAAHGNRSTIHLNYLLNHFGEINLADLIDNEIEGVRFIQDFCRNDLKRQNQVDGTDGVFTYDEWIYNGTENPFEFNINLTKEILLFSWPAYVVGPYAWGPRYVNLTFKELLERGLGSTLLKQILYHAQ